jgi:hypothetical protein
MKLHMQGIAKAGRTIIPYVLGLEMRIKTVYTGKAGRLAFEPTNLCLAVKGNY